MPRNRFRIVSKYCINGKLLNHLYGERTFKNSLKEAILLAEIKVQNKLETKTSDPGYEK